MERMSSYRSDVPFMKAAGGGDSRGPERPFVGDRQRFIGGRCEPSDRMNPVVMRRVTLPMSVPLEYTPYGCRVRDERFSKW